MFNISPILRITVGLLLLTVSLILIADLIGLVPDEQESKIKSRKAVAETLAVQVTSQVQDNRLDRAMIILDAIIKHNQDIQSVGLRSIRSGLVAATSNHAKNWDHKDADKSSKDHILVPIFDSQGKWGALEVSFKPIQTSIFDWQSQSLFTFIFFTSIAGFVFYWLFLKKVLSELDPSSAVPDRVRSALDVLAEGIVIVDQSERIVLVNRAFEDKVDMTESELFGKHLTVLDWINEPEDGSFVSSKFPWTELFETNQIPQTRHLKLKTECKGTLTVDVNVGPIYTNNDIIKGVIVTIDDVTILEKKNSELAHTLNRLKVSQEEIIRQNIELAELATRDPLTHALNRRSLFEGFEKLLLESVEQSSPVSCIILDIDHFKAVNDNYGHAAGDKVIKTIANVCQEFTTADGLLGRYGGEEFVMVIPGLDELKTAELAEEVRIEIEAQIVEFEGKALNVTSSFGVSTFGHDDQSADSLVDQADQALYRSKESGRNRVTRYSKLDLNEQEQFDVERKPRARVDRIRFAPYNLITLSTEGEFSVIPDSEYIDADGDLSIDAFDKMGNSSRLIVVDRLTQAIKNANRNGTQLAVLTIFIDTIQTVNNTIGYATAEKLRKIAYKRLNEIFRESDSVLPEGSIDKKSYTLSRSGDSEFIAVITDLDDQKKVTWISQRLFEDLKKEVDLDGRNIVMTANVGASMYPNDGNTAEGLMSNSGMALEEANRLKERENFLFYNQKMNVYSTKQLEIESQLYQAIENDEFVLYYQPIVSALTGRVEKFESLIRWNHPEHGLVSPHTFIDIAENSGVIKNMGMWIIENAVRQLKQWHKKGDTTLNMSINISAAQFSQPNLAIQIVELVEKLEVDPHDIIFEITENTLINRYEQAIKEINILSNAGFSVALDDFGTGYSSLDFLRKFPINWVKIDRSFMQEFPNNINDVSIVSGLIGLSHNLGMRVIAEGVEEESQFASLIDLRCDQIQGYLVSRPLTAEQATLFIQEGVSQALVREIRSEFHTQEQILGAEEAITTVLNSSPSR